MFHNESQLFQNFFVQNHINAYMFFFEVCSTPPTRYGLIYTIGIRQIPDKWADGDEITYRCTGSGLISGSVANECQDNGQWSLTSLPLCCKLN